MPGVCGCSPSMSTTASRYDILSVPTLILFRDGQPVERFTGRITEKRLTAALTAHLDQE